jgi:hypothetical protein
MTYRLAFPVLALLMAGGCSGRDATGPATKDTRPSTSAVSSSRNAGDGNDGEDSRRSGALHVTKECSEYTGLAGSFCTITSSNLKQIAVGSRVVYAKAAGATSANTDVILYAPGRGNTAFGHVVLDFVTATGTVTFWDGTGKLRGFHASADISYLGGPNWAWDGTYSFSDEDDRDDRDDRD